MKNTRLYLSNWSYNAALILQELENIILNEGGAIVSDWKKERETFTITNRTLSGAIREQLERVERLKRLSRAALYEEQKKLERLESIDNEPKTIFYGDFLYICFTLNGYYYYYSVDRNPFFDFHFGKVMQANDGTIQKNYYIDNDKKEWLYDCFFRFDCSDADRREAAHLILNMLQAAPASTRYRNKTREKNIKLNILMEK